MRDGTTAVGSELAALYFDGPAPASRAQLRQLLVPGPLISGLPVPEPKVHNRGEWIFVGTLPLNQQNVCDDQVEFGVPLNVRFVLTKHTDEVLTCD